MTLVSGNFALDKQLSRWYSLYDHDIQLALVEAVAKGIRFPLVPAGRRCLAKGTLVATPEGPKKIEQIKKGDVVFGYNGAGEVRETYVKETFVNGIKAVNDYTSRSISYFAATPEHQVLACNQSDFDKRNLHLVKGYREKKVASLTKRDRVRRVFLGNKIKGGNKSLKNAYTLGALLGDGCCRENVCKEVNNQSAIYISSSDNIVPEAIASELGARAIKTCDKNYTWKIQGEKGITSKIPFYNKFLHNKYAHEKYIPFKEVESWDRETSLSFLAGVLDSDGSIFFKNKKTKKQLVISLGMQAKGVVDACAYIFHRFFQEKVHISEDKREKYKNGSVFTFRTKSNIHAKNVYEAVKPYIKRKTDIDLGKLNFKGKLPDRIGLSKGRRYYAETFDIHVDNDTNLYLLHDGGIVTHNSGKTERFKRFLVKRATAFQGLYFAAAPTHDQAKKIYWDDLNKLCLSSMLPKKPNKSERIIYLPNGSEIHIFGLDKPERIEGIPWTGGGIDEFADIKDGAWEAHIYPALNTIHPERPDYRAWCWLLGVPDGLNHYYDLCQKAESGVDPNYKVFHWMTEEVFPEMAAEARKIMSLKQYRQEFQASFETASGRIYEDYSKENQTFEEIKPHEKLLWMHDQNYTPLSSAIAVERGDKFLILDEIILESAISKQSALEFVERYKNHKNKIVEIYGDPAGRAGEKHGHASDYTEIEDVLRANGWTFERCVKRKHPAIKDRQNNVRAMILTAENKRRLFINPQKAEWCHKGLSTVQTKNGSSFLEDEKNKYQHVTTAIGYCISYKYPINKVAVNNNMGIAMPAGFKNSELEI